MEIKLTSNTATRASSDLLDALHFTVCDVLLSKLRAGEASPADIAAAIRFLKDNNITALIDANPGLKALVSELPNFVDTEDE